MKIKIMTFVTVLTMLLSSYATASSPPWTGTGQYTFDDNDSYFSEGSITDYATVDITGGGFGALHCYSSSIVNMSDGYAGSGILAYNASTLWLSGGDINSLLAYHSSTINMDVSTYSLDPDAYLNSDGQLTGTWNDGSSFDIRLGEDSWSHFNIIPEPCSLVFISFGSFVILRIRLKKNAK